MVHVFYIITRFDLSKINKENLYATLPKGLTEKQLLVKARVEDPETQKSRKEITENKSVAELSQVHSMADFPIPTTIETLIENLPRLGSYSESYLEKRVRDLVIKNVISQILGSTPQSP